MTCPGRSAWWGCAEPEALSEMKVSVVIPTHNKVDLLKQTLAALETQEQVAASDWEIVVVNDKFGIRLTDVVSPAERVRKLR